MPKLSLVQAVNLCLSEEMDRDPNVVLLGEDIGQDGGVFRATEGLLDRFGKDRVIDTPLSESALVGAAIGMAAYGLIPVVEIQFMGFLYASLEQLISHAARLRTRSRGRYSCPIVVRTPYGGGIHAPELHSESNEAILAHIPGLKVVVPSTPVEARGLLASAIREPDPVIFLEPARIYRAIKEEITPGENGNGLLPLGQIRLVQEGTDITLISWGAMLHPTLKAAALVQEKGIRPEVIDVRTLSPLDMEGIVASVKKTGRAVVVHEAPKSGGLGAEIAAGINEKALLHLEAPVVRVGGFDTPFPLPRLESFYLPTAERIVQAILHTAEF